MDNATRRQILERVKQLGYPNTVEALQNPQVLDQYEQQQLQTQSQQQQQQQPIQQPEPISFPTTPVTTPNYKVPQSRQSEAKPLVMSFNQTTPQLMKDGGIKFVKGGPKEETTMSSEEIRNEWSKVAPQSVKKLYADLDTEKERVAKVRANVPIEADKLDKSDDFMYSDYIEEHPEEAKQIEKNKQLYDKYLSAKNPKELEIARQNLPAEIRKLLINDGKYNVATWDESTQKWNPNATPERELYCTPYGCYTYQLAGAKDVPIVSGNIGFVDMVKTGKLPFEEVSNPEKGDVGVLVGAAPKVYTNPKLGYAIRPHHTVIYDSTDANGNINAYNANNGTRLNYLKSNLQLEPSNTNSSSQYMDYYRYVGNTKNIQDKLNTELKANPKLQELENQLKIQQELENKDSLNRIQPLDMKSIRPASQQLELASNKKYGGVKFDLGGPKDKGWQEFKTPTGQSLYLDPRFKNQRYYVDEKGNMSNPDQNLSLYDVKSGVWEAGTSMPTLEIKPRYRYEKRPGALGSFETIRIDDDNNTKQIISPNPMETRREQEKFVNSFNPAGMATEGLISMGQGNIGQGLTELAFSSPLLPKVLSSTGRQELKHGVLNTANNGLTKLENNAGKFYKPKEAVVLKNTMTPEKLKYAAELETAEGLKAYNRPDKMQAIKDFVNKTSLTDDEIQKVFGDSKENLLLKVEKPERVINSAQEAGLTDAQWEQLTTPAYLRRGVRLSEAPAETTSEMSMLDVIGAHPDIFRNLTNNTYVTPSRDISFKRLSSGVKGLFKPTAYTGDYTSLTPVLHARHFASPRKMHAYATNELNQGLKNLNIGQVATGSTSTSHNSYLAQMDFLAQNAGKQGLSDMVFLGHKPMNSEGFLSNHFSKDELLQYVNTKLNQIQTKRNTNLNLKDSYPYIAEDNNIMIPQYGVKKIDEGFEQIKKKDGGLIKNKKCYTCMDSKMKVLYNKANYKK